MKSYLNKKEEKKLFSDITDKSSEIIKMLSKKTVYFSELASESLYLSGYNLVSTYSYLLGILMESSLNSNSSKEEIKSSVKDLSTSLNEVFRQITDIIDCMNEISTDGVSEDLYRYFSFLKEEDPKKGDLYDEMYSKIMKSFKA